MSRLFIPPPLATTTAPGLVQLAGQLGGTAASPKVLSGWIPADETWTYASSTTFTISGDYTGVYQAGMKLRLTNSTVKYFIVTKVAHATGTTTVTVYGGTDYSLANTTISATSYSFARGPFGFPLDPSKWTVTTTNSTETSQNSPTQDTWYNIGTISIAIPTGIWDVYYQATLQVTGTAAAGMMTLSTANNSESDTAMTAMEYTSGTTFETITTFFRRKNLVLTSDTTHYLNEKCPNTSATLLRINPSLGSDTAPLIIRAVCAYL